MPTETGLGVAFSPLLQPLGPVAALRIAELATELGYRSFWTVESVATEAFSLLGAVTARAPSLDLGTGIVPLSVRSPALAAMAATTLQLMSPDRRVHLGIGVSSPFVTRQHSTTYAPRPLAQVREYVTVLRACLSGEKVDFEGEFYQVKGFRLRIPLGRRRPLIVLGALNENMLRLAGEIADGVLLNYVPASHVPWCVERVREGGAAAVFGYVHIGLCARSRYAADSRRHLAGHAVVDGYAKAFSQAGYGESVTQLRAHFSAGRRDQAYAAVSDAMVDGIDPMGDADLVRSTVRDYREAGVEFPIVFPLAWQPDSLALAESTMRAAAEDSQD